MYYIVYSSGSELKTISCEDEEVLREQIIVDYEDLNLNPKIQFNSNYVQFLKSLTLTQLKDRYLELCRLLKNDGSSLGKWKPYLIFKGEEVNIPYKFED